MKLRKRFTMTAAATALALGGLLGSGVGPAGAATEADVAVQQEPAVAVGLAAQEAVGFDDAGALAYADCTSGYICFFSAANGGGSKCQWSSALNSDTRPQCSWMNSGTTAKSVYNRTSYRYHYYLDKNYKNRLGSTLSGGQGNLAGSYTIGSLCRHNASGCPN
ncbi:MULTISPECIES: peptidase inhibitor family I36 protein [Streptomyces]|uniref:peptidase inhibitor family I36 protein n=1 Tax=Streptomyces TaxID=1883 RepID=UPI001903DE4C|nr:MULTISPECIES: peptidase inhibitor family I36 protein [unclassified Streptomyces]MCU4748355.1 peptidase inhibitor family I36 protein [Streptomyces sp. G-5]QQN78912.1 peptidase inhibitor family I36 protein [Streptomyces sp. XC 2026]